jgi:hypothetical protein
MFSISQQQHLNKLLPGLQVLPWSKSQGWGTAQIASIWRAYALAAEACGNDDYVARIDADVFFFSPWLFDLVLKSDCDLVGDGHYVRFEFSQGGMYFLKAGAVRAICSFLEQKPLELFLKERKINVEDMAAYNLITATGHKSYLTWFMMFPDEYRIARRLTKYQRWKFACLHFVMRNKDKMLEAYRKEMVSANERDEFEYGLSAT